MTAKEKLISILPAIARLNSWARLPSDDQIGNDRLVSLIYKWKRSVISAAMKLGVASQRIVAVERTCRTCQGTGTYKWVDWYDEYNVDYQTCRRCSGTAKVILRFVETTIESDLTGQQWCLHTPRPKWDLGIFEAADFEAVQPGGTDWEPEQPGSPLNLLELVRLLNCVESIIYEGRSIETMMGSASDYTLDLGSIPSCWVCGAGIGDEDKWTIYRSIGLKWEQGICDRCNEHIAWRFIGPTWPVNLHRFDADHSERNNWPAWADRVPLPLIAGSPEIAEWLARRRVYVGCYSPGDYAFTCSGEFVRVVDASTEGYEVEILDHHYGYEGLWDGAVIKLAHGLLRPTARNPYIATELDL